MDKKTKPDILIVDDDQQVLKSLKIWLKNEGFNTITAANEEEALDIIEHNDVDVALVDLKMDDNDGIQVAGRLKAAASQMGVIILTGFPSYESAVEAMKIGASDYLSKGSSNETIMMSIRKAISENSGFLGLGEDDQFSQKNLKVILFCDHSLIKERLENISQGSPSFHLLRTFPQIDYVKIKDFLLEIDIALVCANCNLKNFKEAYHVFPELYRCFPKIKPVIINENFSDTEKVELLRLGVRGFASPDLNSEKLEKGLLSVKEGGFLVSQNVVNLSLQTMIDHNPTPQVKDRDMASLTIREVEILKTMALGLKNREIADRLFISEKTVKTHINRIFKKLGVNNRAKAIRTVMERKML